MILIRYAWSGGGNKIVRVDLTADGGKSWHVAKLIHDTDPNGDQSNLNGRNWAWACELYFEYNIFYSSNMCIRFV